MVAGTATRPRTRDRDRKPSRPTSRQAPNPETPRKGDRGVPEQLEARARGREGERNREASSGAFADIDDRLTALESRPATAPSSSRTPRSSSTSSTGPKPALPIRFTRPAGGFPSIAAPMAVELLLVTADEILTQRRPPLPSRLLVVFAVFGALGLARGEAATPAAALGWGLVVATFYASSVPGTKPAGLRAIGAVGDFLSGKYARRPAG